jgi:hypothetical protein
MRSHWMCDLWILLRRPCEDTKTPGRKQCGDQGRGWREAATSQGAPGPLRAGRGRRGLPRAFQEQSSAGPLTPDTWSPDPWGIKCCCLIPAVGGAYRSVGEGWCLHNVKVSVVEIDISELAKPSLLNVYRYDRWNVCWSFFFFNQVKEISFHY